MASFYQLFLSNLKMFYREKEGLYWTVLMPSAIYIALSVIPIGKFINSNMAYSSFLLPGLIAMTIMQGGIYSLAYWMVDLKSRGVIKRLLATPLKQWQLMLSLVCARLVIVIIQVIILTLLGKLVFHAAFAGNILSILILVLLGGGIFLLIGLLISNYAKSYDSAAPITSAIGLPLPFLSSVFYPLDFLPTALQKIAKILPMTYLADGLRQAYLYPFNFQKIGFDILVLAIWLIAMLALTLSLFRLKE
ncbi:MAG: ABC transporter permease [Candidatus Doudnabacteria bacterium]|nr:ABC transporter permease [Candidatus Doudnabacteria bacterium]